MKYIEPVLSEPVFSIEPRSNELFGRLVETPSNVDELLAYTSSFTDRQADDRDNGVFHIIDVGRNHGITVPEFRAAMSERAERSDALWGRLQQPIAGSIEEVSIVLSGMPKTSHRIGMPARPKGVPTASIRVGFGKEFQDTLTEEVNELNNSLGFLARRSAERIELVQIAHVALGEPGTQPHEDVIKAVRELEDELRGTNLGMSPAGFIRTKNTQG